MALLFSISLSAAEISGTIINATGTSATASIDGDAAPAAGDSAEIFFKVPGSDTEVSVANGKVASVEARTVKITIEKATGTIEKSQLVRITPGGKLPATEAPAPLQAANSNSLLGDWTGAHHPGAAKISFSFKDDNTLLWVIETATSADSVTAKYRVNSTVTPHVVEFFDFDGGEMKGHTAYGLFELQSDGRLKLDIGEKPDHAWDERETIFLSRATTPIVRPATVAAPTPTPDTRPLDEQKLSAGNERFDGGDYEGAIAAYTEAINFNPKNAPAYFRRGRAFSRKNDNDSALADYTKSMELEPGESTQNSINEIKNAQSRELVSKGYHEKGKLNGLPDSVLKDTTKAIELNPKNVGAYTQRGFYYYQNGDRAAAVRDFNQAIALDPSGTKDLKDLVDSINAEEAPKKKKSKR